MELLLFRHGIAEPAGDVQSGSGLDDFDRRLTPRGIQRTAAAIKGLVRVADRPEVILTSPKLRATQTAGILGDAYDMVPQAVPAMGGESVMDILAALRKRTEHRVIMVGHEPTLSKLVADVCLPEHRYNGIEFKKAGCAQLELTLRSHGPVVGRLVWLLTPRVLRALGDG